MRPYPQLGPAAFLLCLLVGCGSTNKNGANGSGHPDSGAYGTADSGVASDSAGAPDAAGTLDGTVSPDGAEATDSAGATDSTHAPGADAGVADTSAPEGSLTAGDASACGACDTPPDDCHATVGTCQGNQCVYEFVTDAVCDDGNPCTVADTCSNGGCYGTPMVCSTPPAAVCISGTEAETYDTTGTCSGGLCTYTSHMTACSGAPCANGACSSDSCGGIVCNTPPSSCYGSAGTCSAGSCSYPYADGTSCDDGNACTTGDQCNTGVCKGAPLACSSPPANVCANASALQVYGAGTCSAGTCSYPYSFESCSGGCASAMCASTGWQTMTSNTDNDLLSVWGSSSTAVWAVGQNGTAVFYDGAEWQVRPLPTQAVNAYVTQVFGTSASNVFAIGEGPGQMLLHYNGTAWSVVVTLASTYDFMTGMYPTGDANNDVYITAVEPNGNVYLLEVAATTGTVSMITSTTSGIQCNAYAGGVWAFSPTNVWVGSCPTMQWSGTAITPMGAIATGYATELWGVGPNAIFGLDYDTNDDGGGDLLFWNGSGWAELNSGLNGVLSGVTATSATRAFVSGWDFADVGAVIYYDGTGFTAQTLPPSLAHLNGIWAAPTGEVFSVGNLGLIVKGP